MLLVCAALVSGCSTPSPGQPTPGPPRPTAAAVPHADVATIQACRRDAPTRSLEVRFPGAFRAFQLTRDETAAAAPSPPPAVLEQWAAILCNYDLAHLTGELRYLGPSDPSAAQVDWRFRITSAPAGQPDRSSTYDLSFATAPDGAIVAAS